MAAKKHPVAKLDVFINYGKPKPFCGDEITSMHDIFRFEEELRTDMGRLECPYPLTFIYQAMQNQPDVSLDELNTRAQKLYEYYSKLGICLEKLSQAPGRMLNIKELVDAACIAVNSNPPFHISEVAPDNFLSCNAGRLYSHDPKLQTWYTNTLAHLHHTEGHGHHSAD